MCSSDLIVELREANAHPVERGGEIAELVATAVAHGLVETATGDPVGGSLEPADAPREDPGAAVAERQGDQQRHTRGQQHPALDEVHAPVLARERIAEGRQAEKGDGEKTFMAAKPAEFLKTALIRAGCIRSTSSISAPLPGG